MSKTREEDRMMWGKESNGMKSSISILIVDDESTMRSLLEKILAREGYQMYTASNGVEALEHLSERKFDIVISDMKMPKMGGFELLKHIKKEYPGAGVIIMTAYGDTYSVKDALLLGADEYITKPFKSYEISLVVERAYWRILSAGQTTADQLS
ncbi:MAG: response regulator [candidate division Zixibacteria bacterium]|nr:response regulator [candidate division Zixibacteria bacterium]